MKSCCVLVSKPCMNMMQQESMVGELETADSAAVGMGVKGKVAQDLRES